MEVLIIEWKNAMRIFATAAIAGCMLAFASGCGKKERAAVPSGESKKLVMVTEATFPPYEYMENSKIVGIDPEIVGEVLSLMKDLAQTGMTMVVVTHEIGFAAEVADRIIFMDNGKILETGSAKQIIGNAANPRIRDFFAKVL